MFQRVKWAKVSVEGERVSSIGEGALVLLGIGKGDTEEDCVYMAEKISGLRVFSDPSGKMNLSLLDVGGEVLLVSQFTLYGDVKKGKRPGFDGAAPPQLGNELYQKTKAFLREKGLKVQRGVFGAHMEVGLLNDGPVTILLSSRKEF